MTGSFKAAYQRNIAEANESLLDDDLIAVAVQRLKLPWEGPARKMLEELNSITDHAHVNAKDWPKEPNALSGRLRRLADGRQTWMEIGTDKRRRRQSGSTVIIVTNINRHS